MQRSKLLILGMVMLIALTVLLGLAGSSPVKAQRPLGITDTPVPTVTPTPTPGPEPPPVVPEASTVILLGGALSGLAGYVGLQLRARRRSQDL